MVEYGHTSKEGEQHAYQWEHERYNKKGFKSQAEYHKAASELKALKALHYGVEANIVGLIALGYGPQRARQLANEWEAQNKKSNG